MWIKNFLTGRVQQVNLCGTLSSVAPCPAESEPNSAISPILFNVYIDELEDTLPEHSNVNVHKYADDCRQHQVVGKNILAVITIYQCSKWLGYFKQNGILNSKTKQQYMVSFLNSIPEPPPFVIGNELAERVSTFKLLRVWYQNNLKWNTMHVEEITRKVNKRLYPVVPWSRPLVVARTVFELVRNSMSNM